MKLSRRLNANKTSRNKPRENKLNAQSFGNCLCLRNYGFV
jgi:hypothetical protein